MINLQNKMAIKVTKKVKYAMALYHKINVTGSTFYMDSFMLFQKLHNFWTMPHRRFKGGPHGPPW